MFSFSNLAHSIPGVDFDSVVYKGRKVTDNDLSCVQFHLRRFVNDVIPASFIHTIAVVITVAWLTAVDVVPYFGLIASYLRALPL